MPLSWLGHSKVAPLARLLSQVSLNVKGKLLFHLGVYSKVLCNFEEEEESRQLNIWFCNSERDLQGHVDLGMFYLLTY